MAFKVSIITIVYNGVDTLEKTIKSIVSQQYEAIEYIIVDGGSKDGTVELILQYESLVSKWISEPDEGLYDAMNKGIKMATGDYLWFINSGDEIYAPDTISQIFAQSSKADIYYGDTVMIDAQGQVIGERRLQPPEQLKWTDFKNGMLVSHQSILIARDIASLYNTRYIFSADFEWCLLALKKAETIINTKLIMSRFLDGGLTKQNIVPGLKERFRIMVKYFGLLSTLWHHIPIGIRFVKYIFKNKRF